LNGYILFLIATVPPYTGRYATLPTNGAKSACIFYSYKFCNAFLIAIPLHNFIAFGLHKPNKLAED